jgi:hypothetical protein
MFSGLSPSPVADAEWNAFVDVEVPEVVSGVYTTAEWREMLALKWFGAPTCSRMRTRSERATTSSTPGCRRH